MTSHAFMRGDLVAYEPHPGAREVGVVIRVTPDWVFVRYGTSEGSKATSHRDLRLLERTEDERGLGDWVYLAGRLTREAALRAVPREDDDDE